MFPYPYTHLTHRKILVESFHEGSPISSYIEHGDTALQRKLAKIGIAVMLQMVNQRQFSFFSSALPVPPPPPAPSTLTLNAGLR